MPDQTQTARVTVAITSLPDTLLEEVIVKVSGIALTHTDGRAVTASPHETQYDLLAGSTGAAKLATLRLRPGRYRHLRLDIAGLQVTAGSAFAFYDGARTKELRVPDGARTGITLDLSDLAADGEDNGLWLREGETVLLVDFDVSANFVAERGPPSPNGINGFLFTPLYGQWCVEVQAYLPRTGFAPAARAAELVGVPT